MLRLWSRLCGTWQGTGRSSGILILSHLNGDQHPPPLPPPSTPSQTLTTPATALFTPPPPPFPSPPPPRHCQPLPNPTARHQRPPFRLRNHDQKSATKSTGHKPTKPGEEHASAELTIPPTTIAFLPLRPPCTPPSNRQSRRPPSETRRPRQAAPFAAVRASAQIRPPPSQQDPKTETRCSRQTRAAATPPTPRTRSLPTQTQPQETQRQETILQEAQTQATLRRAPAHRRRLHRRPIPGQGHRLHPRDPQSPRHVDAEQKGCLRRQVPPILRSPVQEAQDGRRRRRRQGAKVLRRSRRPQAGRVHELGHLPAADFGVQRGHV